MTANLDLTGKVFGLLTALKYQAGSRTQKARWYCQCSCGGTALVQTSNLRSGNSKSCGCISTGRISALNKTHGLSGRTKGGKGKHTQYGVWRSMRNRCNNPREKAYKHYGGRGVKVCEEWTEFPAFYSWSLASGYMKGLQLDRIDNNKGYSPDNCRWVDVKTNCRNTRRNRVFEIDGELLCISEIAERYGHRPLVLTKRLKRGWDIVRAATTPLQHRTRSK